MLLRLTFLVKQDYLYKASGAAMTKFLLTLNKFASLLCKILKLFYSKLGPNG
ncbi:hypothetical protein N483_22805 [Pseudoalteromonas luteoviolacea NCIMB 1944]|nr:hypothetical protein N483_22805 [Pseudoalteromonas luteoviolacea NCIMB 1944]